MDCKIQVITYEEARLQFFEDQIKSYERSLGWWQNHAASRGYNWTDIHDRCSEIGWRINFYRDAIKALKIADENNIDSMQKNSE